jgi:hypothetical protein
MQWPQAHRTWPSDFFGKSNTSTCGSSLTLNLLNRNKIGLNDTRYIILNIDIIITKNKA